MKRIINSFSRPPLVQNSNISVTHFCQRFENLLFLMIDKGKITYSPYFPYIYYIYYFLILFLIFTGEKKHRISQAKFAHTGLNTFVGITLELLLQELSKIVIFFLSLVCCTVIMEKKDQDIR